MNQIQQITDVALQTQTVSLSDGSQMTFTLYFASMQYGWFITSLSYGNFSLQGIRVTNSPNFLHQFRNQIPFGIQCASSNGREPSQLQDFSSGASSLYLLTPIEVAAYAQYLTGSTPQWSSTTSYSYGTLATYQGIVYFSLLSNNLGNTPGSSTSSSYWSIYG